MMAGAKLRSRMSTRRTARRRAAHGGRLKGRRVQCALSTMKRDDAANFEVVSLAESGPQADAGLGPAVPEMYRPTVSVMPLVPDC